MDYLRARLTPGFPDQLSTIADSARSAGVSYVTMWKAFATLRKNGEISKHTPLPASEPKTRQWQRVQEMIVRDVICGRISSARTLSLKSLTVEYGACYRTILVAIESLTAKGWLTREKKQYRVLSPAAGQAGDTVVLLSTIDRSRSVATLSSRFQELVRSTEIHCSRMRLGLEPVFLRKQHGGGPHPAIPSAERVAGYLVWIGNLETEHVTSLLDLLARTGKPVAILDETGEVSIDTAMRAAGPHTGFFSLANSRTAGRSMGRYLLNLGHKRIGFFSDSKGQRWADNRYAGLCEAYALAGPGYSTHFLDVGPGTPKKKLHALIDTALMDPSITAWVALTDALAIEVCEGLSARGLKPGRDVSTAGFDDTPDAFLHNLTSYNFNCEATIHAMLAYLAGRGPRLTTVARHEPLEIEGFITPRKSTLWSTVG